MTLSFFLWLGQGAAAGGGTDGIADAAATSAPLQHDEADQVATQPATQPQVRWCSTAPLAVRLQFAASYPSSMVPTGAHLN